MRLHTKPLAAVLTLILAGAMPGLAVAAGSPDLRHASPDLLPGDAARLQRLRNDAAMMSPFGVTDADVGDANSFGRNVVYIGLVQSGQVTLQESCVPAPGDPPLGPDDRCVTVNPQPASTSFSFNDLGRITLPAKSTRSLICFHSTTFQYWDFLNETASNAAARIRFRESVTIENPLLNDPSLIDPNTGLPFNGKFDVSIGTSLNDSETPFAPAQNRNRNEIVSRTCIAGAVSKRALRENYGLPDTIVDKFFKQPITIRVNLAGNAALVDYASLIYGVRFFGD